MINHPDKNNGCSLFDDVFNNLLNSNSSNYENKKILLQDWNALMSVLTDYEKKVFIMRLGLLDGRKKALDEVGKELCITREETRQNEVGAYRKLKHPLYMRIYGFLINVCNVN